MRMFGASQPSWARILTVALAGASTAQAVTLDVEDGGMCMCIGKEKIIPRLID